MHKLVLVALFSLCFVASRAQIFSDSTGGPIPDNGSSATAFPLTVNGVKTLTSSLGIASVTINIDHPFIGDLIVRLQSPNKTILTLSNQNGGQGANYTNTTFTYTATLGITKGIPPFSNSYLPEDSLGKFNDGQTGNGVWNLLVQDVAGGEVGKVVNWNINFNNKPAPPLSLIPTANNLFPATGTCDSAPTLNSLSIFKGSTSMAYSPPKSWPKLATEFCGSIENCSFIKFVATAITAKFNIWVYNSSYKLGLQMFIWEGQCNGLVSSLACFSPVIPTTSAQPISVSGLMPGKTYYIMFDGYAGDVCDYTLVPVSGVSDGTISTQNATTVCRGTPVKINVKGITGATYTWTSSANPSGLDTTKGTVVNVNTAVLPTGKNTFTVNGLYPNAANYAKGVIEVTVVDTPTIINQPTPTVQTSTVDSSITTLNVYGHSQVGGDRYQWYKNVLNSNTGGDSITAAIAANYLPPSNSIGNIYYYCVVTNDKGCKSTTNIATVSIIPTNNIIPVKGTVKDPLNNPVNNISVNIKGNVLGSINNLQLSNLPLGHYTIKPTKNNDSSKTNGISTLDLLQTMGNILNKYTFNSPYKIIAADVNGDDKISTLDVLSLQRMVLGTDSSFAKKATGENRTWVFVDSAFAFANTSNPFPYKDSIKIQQTSGKIAKPSFIAIKLGDVNWDRDISKNLVPVASPTDCDVEKKSKLKAAHGNFTDPKKPIKLVPDEEKDMD